MSKTININFSCPKCNNTQEITLYTSITGSNNPKLKTKFLNNELNFFHCNNCRSKYKIEIPILYHDIKNQFAIWYTKDKNFIPEQTNVNNYIFNAEIINDLEELKQKIILFENKVIFTDFNNQKIPIEMNFDKYKNIDECLIDLKHIHNLNDIKCKYCQKPDHMYGFSVTCEHCGKNINTKSNEKLFIALRLLQIFNHYLNVLTVHKKAEINNKINEVLYEIKFFNTKKKFKNLNQYLQKIKIIGNPKTLTFVFTNKWEVLINSENIDKLHQISENPEEIIISSIALNNYINNNEISNNQFVNILKKFVLWLFK